MIILANQARKDRASKSQDDKIDNNYQMYLSNNSGSLQITYSVCNAINYYSVFYLSNNAVTLDTYKQRNLIYVITTETHLILIFLPILSSCDFDSRSFLA